jgi:diaminopimelate epimerase
MKLRFTKMHGLGNDFIVFDAVRQRVELSAAQVRVLADRRFGIGCDQVLLAERASKPGADFRYRIFNADGSEVEHCGNGVRCLGRFLVDQGLTDKRRLTVETLAGDSHIELRDDGLVSVDMGAPRLEPAQIPFRAEQQAESYEIEVDGQRLRIGAASMGNPHAVTVVDDVAAYPVERVGPLVEAHPRFPRRVNAGFMQVVGPHRIKLRVYERGAGETLACGTGACAAAVVGVVQGRLQSPVTVELPGGRLLIEWAGPGQPVRMTGPAVTVFQGEIEVQ